MITLLTGDCRRLLPTLDAGSVQCVITSPPYFGLRDYGVAGQIGLEPLHDCLAWARSEQPCGACYVCTLRAVFAAVWRVLRDDGIAFCNLGDSYLGNKQLGGTPWRVALALQSDGWYLRSDVIWSKPNPMPESVTDRPTRAHEYIFVLTKRERYFWDQEAVRERAAESSEARAGIIKLRNPKAQDEPKRHASTGNGLEGYDYYNPAGRNLRSVWTIATQPYAGAHFATFPEALVARCILAGTSPQACEVCGAPWARVVERVAGDRDGTRPKATQLHASGKSNNGTGASTLSLSGNGSAEWAERGSKAVTTGFVPTCRCPDTTGSAACVVLDPFAGSGTVLRVAIKHNRNAIGIDLSPDYADLQLKRTDGVQRVLL